MDEKKFVATTDLCDTIRVIHSKFRAFVRDYTRCINLQYTLFYHAVAYYVNADILEALGKGTDHFEQRCQLFKEYVTWILTDANYHPSNPLGCESELTKAKLKLDMRQRANEIINLCKE